MKEFYTGLQPGWGAGPKPALSVAILGAELGAKGGEPSRMNSQPLRACESEMELQLRAAALVCLGLLRSLNPEGNEMNNLTSRLPPNTVKIKVPDCQAWGVGHCGFLRAHGYHILSRERLGDAAGEQQPPSGWEVFPLRIPVLRGFFKQQHVPIPVWQAAFQRDRAPAEGARAESGIRCVWLSSSHCLKAASPGQVLAWVQSTPLLFQLVLFKAVSVPSFSSDQMHQEVLQIPHPAVKGRIFDVRGLSLASRSGNRLRLERLEWLCKWSPEKLCAGRAT